MRPKFSILFVFAGLLAACAPTIANRGNIIDPDKLAEIKSGTSTREEVVARLGTPTMVSTFDDKTWYYAGRNTEQYSFFDPEVMKQQAVEVKFDDQGVVTTVSNLDLSEAKDIDPVDRRTPTYGNDDTFIKQLIGNLSHPIPSTDTKHEGQ
ncbi:MAG TPA: outer membrane protein assembly factor BamE [Alphaproteobacteria bacterium]|nr:outer membrane protein assembly factor BamE [Alphaproteobacteria bacterium]